MSRAEKEAKMEELYKADCRKYGSLPHPTDLRKTSDNQYVAVYPDGTFPRPAKPTHSR